MQFLHESIKDYSTTSDNCRIMRSEKCNNLPVFPVLQESPLANQGAVMIRK